MIAAQIIKNERSEVTTVNNDATGQVASLSLPTDMKTPESPVLNQTLALQMAFEKFVPALNDAATTYNPATLPGKLQMLASTILARPFQALTSAGQAAKAAEQAAYGRLIAVPPAANDTEAQLRGMDRAAFAPMDISAKAAWVNNASVDQLASVIEAGQARFADVREDMWSTMEDRYALLNFIRISGLQADFQLPQTVENPLAAGPDIDAAQQAAEVAMLRHRQRGALVQQVAVTLQGVISVVAVSCGVSLDTALLLLTGAAT